MKLLQYLKSKIFIRTIILMGIIVIALIFGLKAMMSYTTNHDQKILVPDLKKMSLSDTETTLSNLNLNFVIQDSASYNPDYPPKSVIDQDPEAGDFVKDGRKIYLTLNPSSYKKIAMPDLLNKTKRQVETHLKSIGFKIGKYQYIPDLGKDVVRKMKYKGKELEMGDLVPKNSLIDLVLGDGTGDGTSVSTDEGTDEN
ncbi:PASTA domain-containing protein [Aureibaculum algae]|uniref:PASTA domain-containing protein n=1 Tax=Aureibaculum algae TaxID=2584122 RepID=A0A5B7TMS9_9FLAO|nr:Stk1 family PASTA domain-containing Ser/Thr kinase [Aureibaculum algae]QCX38129.1 PASTA domain-containing protein [Aureibaculum algae]